MDFGVKGGERKTSFGAAERGVGAETGKKSPMGIQRRRSTFFKLSCRRMKGVLNFDSASLTGVV